MYDCFSPVIVNYTTAVIKAMDRKRQLFDMITSSPPPPRAADPYKVDTTMDAALNVPFFTYPSTYL